MLVVMETQDRQEIRNQLSLYKVNGLINYERVLSIPGDERINNLIQLPNGRNRVSAALSASIKSAFEAINLRVGMNVEQILDLADEIIDQSSEDNLALEDVLLFLQQLITGKAGKIFDRMDIPTFFELFETYRQSRHEEVLNIREQEQANHKAYGDPSRTSDERTDSEVVLHQEMVKLFAKLNTEK